MSRYKIGDKVRSILAFSQYYDKPGVIVRLAQFQYSISGECSPTYNFVVRYADGTEIVLHESYLAPIREV